MSRDLGRDILDLEKLYARELWPDFSFPKEGGIVAITFGRLVEGTQTAGLQRAWGQSRPRPTNAHVGKRQVAVLGGTVLKFSLRTEKYLPQPPREQEKKIFRGKLWLHPPLWEI